MQQPQKEIELLDGDALWPGTVVRTWLAPHSILTRVLRLFGWSPNL